MNVHWMVKHPKPPPRALLTSALLPGQHTLDKVNFLPTLPHPLAVFTNLPLQKRAANLKAMPTSPGEPHAPGPRSELLWVRGYCLAPSLSKLCLFKVYVRQWATTNRRTTGNGAIWRQILLRDTD